MKIKKKIAVILVKGNAQFEQKYFIKGQISVKMIKGDLVIKMGKDAECYAIKDKGLRL